MPEIPRTHQFDSTLALKRDPYRFISRTARTLRADVFRTRLLLRPTICMTGRDACELFYDKELFQRAGAAPRRVQRTLFGQGGVQGLDGHAHAARKAALLQLVAPDRRRQLLSLFVSEWETAAARWERMPSVAFYEEVKLILGTAVCRWCGLDQVAQACQQRTAQLADLFEGAGGLGLRHLHARRSRRLLEDWLGSIVAEIRSARIAAEPQSPLALLASVSDEHGRPLPQRVVAVELLNLLRPTVAVAVYIALSAHALHRHPAYAELLRTSNDPAPVHAFVQEVRRFYPFFPAVVARTRQAFEWRGYTFPANHRVLLDLFGTNRDPRAWLDPDRFWPHRFDALDPDPYALVPQGGADSASHHRCLGEQVTIDLMQASTVLLARHMSYDVPRQDLRIDESMLPALPRSRMVLTNVRLLTPQGEE